MCSEEIKLSCYMSGYRSDLLLTFFPDSAFVAREF